MSLLYWLSKFSHEAILIELFLIACVTTSWFGYLLTKKRRYGAAKKNIPDNVVRAFLIELISHAEGFKSQLFGENFKIPASAKGIPAAAQAASALSASDGAELSALKAQLAAMVGKHDELSKLVSSLTAEKGALEARLADAAANPGTPAPAASDAGMAEAKEKISKLESKLAEYEVIEDDLANLKKYQQENKQLRAQLEALQRGGTVAAVPIPAPAKAAAPAPTATAAPAPPVAPSPIAAAEEQVTESAAAESFEGIVDKVEESLAPEPAGASAIDPAVVAQAQTAPPASDASAAATAASAPTPGAADAPKQDKTDADLLNEFERMLSS